MAATYSGCTLLSPQHVSTYPLECFPFAEARLPLSFVGRWLMELLSRLSWGLGLAWWVISEDSGRSHAGEHFEKSASPSWKSLVSNLLLGWGERRSSQL